ncbi:hypothetical protein [Priestia abyssalis]|uniref:hypothetical protein n=1 Tax=Priestia abyssalis TaxID=1221450 RepID=UPI0009952E2A|nr:hypothetical protein [Priestia abyssalis]
MGKLTKMYVVICLLVFLPILSSLDSPAYDSNYYAKYTSPEGISFLSYTETWDEEKLKGLYEELLKNKHGSEIYLLQEVQVKGGSHANAGVKAHFHALTNTITLYNGDTYTEPASYRETLSHEYGHHFAYYHVKSHHFPFSKWADVRGLENEPVRWDAFWNYSGKHHQWFPQEIMADDYVLLYSATEPTDVEDVYSNEAFYRRTEHENQKIQNALDNKELHRYLEKATGLKIDKNRLLKTPKLHSLTMDALSFSITEKEDVAYRLNLSLYEQEGDSYTEDGYHEITAISSAYDGNEITFSLDSVSLPSDGYMKVNVDVLDLTTSLGFQTEAFYVKVQDDEVDGPFALDELN